MQIAKSNAILRVIRTLVRLPSNSFSSSRTPTVRTWALGRLIPYGVMERCDRVRL